MKGKNMNNVSKYKPSVVVDLPDRQWPNRVITKAPIWCSVDLRDGNQSLAEPMDVEQKLEFFKTLVACGFKEIEVGFPASSDIEHQFLRRLIEENLIPDDVTIQVLVQAREDLIIKTVESLRGARRVIIHMYNSTSPVQRRVVFEMTKAQTVELAVRGAEWVKKYSAGLGATEVLYQYSPESFSATEVDFSVQICEAVMDVWQPTPEKKIILNLPNTVEVAMPNVYVDQVEWFCRHIGRRNSVVISVHSHNDRGTGVAATEQAMLAGAERVEGTLFGNGERTGNCDIITVALNLYTQGIDPELDFSNLDQIREVYERCTGMTVPARQPYSGDLVFTAFSGSHQDAIRKGLSYRELGDAVLCIVPHVDTEVWDVPYLVMDPNDVGREYKPIRVNGQSGKGGIAFLLETECHINLPKAMLIEFGQIAGPQIDKLGREVTAGDLETMFRGEYDRNGPYKLRCLQVTEGPGGCNCVASVVRSSQPFSLAGEGNGPIDAFVNSLQAIIADDIRVVDQAEHALGGGANACAISYVQLRFNDGITRWGSGIDTSIPQASAKAVLSALNRKE